MDKLPPDVIYRIADRLSFKCLGRFRRSRKEWLTDPFLKKTYDTKEPITLVALDIDSRRSDQDQKPVFEVDRDRSLVKASIPQVARGGLRSRLMGTCNGLMCFLQEDPAYFLLLVNPLQEEVLPVSTWSRPGGGERKGSFVRGPGINLGECNWRASGLGLDRLGGVYKLVLFSGRKILLFNFSTRSWWRKIRSPGEGIVPWGEGIFLRGTLYWQRCRHPSHIVSFDVAEEVFSFLSCPISIDTLFDLGNHLGVADFNKPAGYFDIWEFNLFNNGWTNKYKIYLPLLLIEGTSMLGGDYFDIVGTQNEMILFKVGKTLHSYDPRSRKLDCVHPVGPATEFYCLREIN